jgi:HD superfamily phosphodiesterase
MWTPEDAQALAATYLEQDSDRWQHVRAVASVARDLVAAGAPLELEMAAWVHDIGYAEPLARTGMHALDGARFLALVEAPPIVVGLVAFHTGAEFEADERGLLGKLLEFERPDQSLLDQMILADMVSGPRGERVSVSRRLGDILTRYEPEHPVHRAVSLSGPYLRLASERASAAAHYPM